MWPPEFDTAVASSAIQILPRINYCKPISDYSAQCNNDMQASISRVDRVERAPSVIDRDRHV